MSKEIKITLAAIPVIVLLVAVFIILSQSPSLASEAAKASTTVKDVQIGIDKELNDKKNIQKNLRKKGLCVAKVMNGAPRGASYEEATREIISLIALESSGEMYRAMKGLLSKEADTIQKTEEATNNEDIRAGLAGFRGMLLIGKGWPDNNGFCESLRSWKAAGYKKFEFLAERSFPQFEGKKIELQEYEDQIRRASLVISKEGELADNFSVSPQTKAIGFLMDGAIPPGPMADKK